MIKNNVNVIKLILIMVFAFNKIVFADSILSADPFFSPSNINDIFQTCDDIVKMKGLTSPKYNNAIENVEVLCLQLTNDKTFVSLLDFGMSSVIEAIEIAKLTGKWNQEKIKKADYVIKNYNDTNIVIAKLEKVIGDLKKSMLEDKLKVKRNNVSK